MNLYIKINKDIFTSNCVINSKYFSSLTCANDFLAICRLKCSNASRANIFQSESVTFRQAI